MNFPEELKYSKEHTWLRIDGNTGTIGITEFAQSELGEICILICQISEATLKKTKFLVQSKPLKQ